MGPSGIRDFGAMLARDHFVLGVFACSLGLPSRVVCALPTLLQRSIQEVTDGRPTCHPPSARNAEVDRVDATGPKVLMQHQAPLLLLRCDMAS